MSSIRTLNRHLPIQWTLKSLGAGPLWSSPNIASTSRRTYTSTQAQSDSDHVATLLQNDELTPEDAFNEIRWITQEVREKAKRLIAKGKMPEIEEDSISEMVARRSKGEPLQYILGTTDFGPLTIQCRRPVLIPRPETAFLTDRLASYISSLVSSLTSRDRPSNPLKILDLCSGTGCIGLLLARLNPLSTVVGIDNSPVAVQLGMVNARDSDLDDRVKFKYGNLFNGDTTKLLSHTNSSLIPPPPHPDLRQRHTGDGKYGMIISNPPYIPYNEYQTLPRSVREYESPSALLGDLQEKHGRGLKYHERISEILPDLLCETEELEQKGWKGVPRLVLEIGKGQSADVVDILRAANGGLVEKTEIWKDQFGVERFVLAWTK
ncbi:uncharacterized protein I303_102895 [Kwoniella dejecticola CBS 10117]|uniref:S-adenosylmethionine-dependent methyltransferase n=1 Tax=Kwoniella dejecticola CBS 10117 TaxID=1296121 RepID=A0A1A6AA11_9TREE|nr:uncharacterized protein I303_02915 [Kwoniella dejecticola CBS 10117]OBR86894.1 hypothetical protein I303_02915 [Kwoniella dejecticola CBS 10117]